MAKLTKFKVLVLSLFCLPLCAQEEREMYWENVTALHFAATGGTDRTNALQQYLLFDGKVLERNQELLDQYKTFSEEFTQMMINQAVPEGKKIIEESVAKLKQVMKEHPEMAETLKEQLKELEAQKGDLFGMANDQVKEYTYAPATILKKLTSLAVNKRTYSAYKDIGNGLYAVKTGPTYDELDTYSLKAENKNDYTWGAIDCDGRQIIKFKYNGFEAFPNQDLIILVGKENDGSIRAGACGYDGRVRIPFIYDDAYQRGAFDHTLDPPKFHLYVFIKDGKFGFIDPDGKVLQPCVYQRAAPYGCGWKVAKDDKNFGLVDHVTGRLVIPLKYKSIWEEEETITKMERYDGKIDVYDENYKLIRTEDRPKF